MDSLKVTPIAKNETTAATVTVGDEIGDAEVVRDILEAARSLPGGTVGLRPEKISYKDGKPVFADRIHPEAVYERLGSYEDGGETVDVFGGYERGRLFGYLEVRRETASDRVVSASRIEPDRYEKAPATTLRNLVEGRTGVRRRHFPAPPSV
jgi:hypothetical protein